MEVSTNSNLVTCSIEIDRDMYNHFKSVCYKEGKSVKQCIIDHMKTVIENNNENLVGGSTK